MGATAQRCAQSCCSMRVPGDDTGYVRGEVDQRLKGRRAVLGRTMNDVGRVSQVRHVNLCSTGCDMSQLV